MVVHLPLSGEFIYLILAFESVADFLFLFVCLSPPPPLFVTPPNKMSAEVFVALMLTEAGNKSIGCGNVPFYRLPSPALKTIKVKLGLMGECVLKERASRWKDFYGTPLH